MKRFSLALILAAGPAFADEVPHTEITRQHPIQAPEPAKPVLTAEEGRKLYELGVKTGMAQAAVQAAQQDMKATLDKLAPPKP